MIRVFAGILALGLWSGLFAPQSLKASDWPFFEGYVRTFVQADGRVIDRDAGARTTSEAESYALFFSLVEGNRGRFETILRWIENNLSDGDLTHHGPAWLWGRRVDGSWGVLDPHTASDADCWLAYDLLEAGRIWHRKDFRLKGIVLLKRIALRNVVWLPGRRAVLLPGPSGFVGKDGTMRLNPSYAPPFLMRRFAHLDPDGPWESIRKTRRAHLPKIAPRGFVPDWYLVRPDGTVAWDPATGPVGSYDAIRVYLWAGIGRLPPGCGRKASLKDYRGMVNYLRTHRIPPVVVNTFLGTGSGRGSAGFSAALLPYLREWGSPGMVRIQRSRIDSALRKGLLGFPPRYYDQNLALFGLGFEEGRFAFSRSGKLLTGPGRLSPCSEPVAMGPSYQDPTKRSP